MFVSYTGCAKPYSLILSSSKLPRKACTVIMRESSHPPPPYCCRPIFKVRFCSTTKRRLRKHRPTDPPSWKESLSTIFFFLKPPSLPHWHPPGQGEEKSSFQNRVLSLGECDGSYPSRYARDERGRHDPTRAVACALTPLVGGWFMINRIYGKPVFLSGHSMSPDRTAKKMLSTHEVSGSFTLLYKSSQYDCSGGPSFVPVPL